MWNLKDIKIKRIIILNALLIQKGKEIKLPFADISCNFFLVSWKYDCYLDRPWHFLQGPGPILENQDDSKSLVQALKGFKDHCNYA